MHHRIGRVLVTATATALVVAGCGGDDSTSSSTDDNTAVSAASETAAPAAAPAATTAGGGGAASASGSTLTLAGETIALTTVRCHLQPQDAAGVGGKILFVVQAEGTDAAGEPVLIDISRYDDDSMFPGDAVEIVVGDYLADEAQNYSGSSPVGTVTLDGSMASADDLVVQLLDDTGGSSDHTASFRITC